MSKLKCIRLRKSILGAPLLRHILWNSVLVRVILADWVRALSLFAGTAFLELLIFTDFVLGRDWELVRNDRG